MYQTSDFMNKKQEDHNKSKEYKFTCEVRIWHYDDTVCLCVEVCVCHCVLKF